MRGGKQTILVLTALLIGAGAAAGWYLCRPLVGPLDVTTVAVPEPLPRPTSSVPHKELPPNVVARVMPRRVTAARAAERAEYPLRLITDDPAKSIAEFKPSVDAEVPAAMRLYGEALRMCAFANMGGDEEIANDVAMQSLDIDYINKNKGMKYVVEGESDGAKAADKLLSRAYRLRESCKRIPAAEITKWRDWFQRAADGGDSRGTELLAQAYWTDAMNKDLPLEQRDEASERAVALMINEVSYGVCGTDELNIIWRNSKDPVLLYVYAGILMQRGLEALPTLPSDIQERERRTIQETLRQLEAAVPPGQLASATATRAYVAQNFCTY